MYTFFKNLKSKGLEPFWAFCRTHIQILDRRVLIFAHDFFALVVAMHLAIWIMVKEDLSVLTPYFALKQSLIFGLIASGFFLWFQTYRGIWRYLTWRQSFLIGGALGFASMIFAPILTKAHMQPIEIPGLVILINWALASLLIIGSRVIFKVFYERWVLVDDAELSSTPLSRILIIGSEKTVKNLLLHLKKQTPHLYDILGIIDTNEHSTKSSINGVKVLGHLWDLPDLIENFNVDGSHPHHIVWADPVNDTLRSFIRSLKEFKVDFLYYANQVLRPVTIKDLYPSDIHPISLPLLGHKNIFLFGATHPLSQDIISMLLKNNFKGHIILSDYPSKDFAALTTLLSHAQVSYYALCDLNKSNLISYFQSHSIDIVLNLQPLQVSNFESIDPGVLFHSYIQHNEVITQAAENANVKDYYFIAQQAPHHPLGLKFQMLATKYLSVMQESLKHTIITPLNLPYVLDPDDFIFSTREVPVHCTQESVNLVSPLYGSYLLLQAIEKLLGIQKSQNKMAKREKIINDLGRVACHTVTYDDLLQDFSTLMNIKNTKRILIEAEGLKNFTWDDKLFKKLGKHFNKQDMNKALESLNAFYPSPA